MPPPKKNPTNHKFELQNHRVFDPWNSSSTGHQHAENPYSGTTSWHDTRSAKLKQQFRGDDYSRNSAGALDDQDFSAKAFDGTCGSVSPVGESYGDITGSGGRTRAGEWRWVSEAEAKRAQLGVRDIRCFMAVGKRKAGDEYQMQSQAEKKARTVSGGTAVSKMLISTPTPTPTPTSATVTVPETSTISTTTSTTKIPSSPKIESGTDHQRQKRIATPSLAPSTTKSSSSTLFTGTTIYINGSTLPQISDHKLKSLLASHGATIAIGMARRTVTHVIIGQPGTTGKGAGGGLAAGKLQGEIERGGWKGVRIVGVDWVLESIKAGKRLAESRFAVLCVAPKGQKSVASMFGGR
ncbi:hypothetical protein PEBR_11668 [Penicillium brasilianum]|uniref:BRCT domain-containing protein n=1 Tax=Penicillium brasilianum TaxID=104259 RepID=A0A1S9RTK6_PENBI|nr:hypothetical protein PEBR_11668 [Penicillium brasilianum]